MNIKALLTKRAFLLSINAKINYNIYYFILNIEATKVTAVFRFDPANYFSSQFCVAAGCIKDAGDNGTAISTQNVIHSKGRAILTKAISEYVTAKKLGHLHVLTRQVLGRKKTVIALSEDWSAIKYVEEKLRDLINTDYAMNPQTSHMRVIFPHDDLLISNYRAGVTVQIATELWLPGSPPFGLA